MSARRMGTCIDAYTVRTMHCQSLPHFVVSEGNVIQFGQNCIEFHKTYLDTLWFKIVYYISTPYCTCALLYSASVLLYFTFLLHLFPLSCGAGSTVPSEGFDSSVIMPFSWCVVAVTLLI